MSGTILHHPLTPATLHLAHEQVRRLKVRRRNMTVEIDEEISRIEKMITSAGLDPQ